MINRELIRLKIVQIIYSYYQSGSHNVDAAENELLLSLSRAYKLYASLLLLMVEVGRMGLRMEEIRRNRARRLGLQVLDNSRFTHNRFLAQLESNRQLREYVESEKVSWAEHESFVRALYTRIEESPLYTQYMQDEEDSYLHDREFWRQAYRQFICANDELDDILEDMDIYWNDDKAIVDTFVLKTIKKFTEGSTEEQPLQPEYRNEDDRNFAVRLLRDTLKGADTYTEYIAANARRWDVNRIALMDRIVLQMALAEIISCPEIPVGVSINEYVELAKCYGSPKSGKYVNATLDAIVKQLVKENKLIKDVPVTLRDTDQQASEPSQDEATQA